MNEPSALSRAAAIEALTHPSLALPPADLARLTTFATALPTPQLLELAALIPRVFDAGWRTGIDTEEQTWLAVARHLGNEAAARVVHAHVTGMYITCQPGDCPTPTTPPAAPPAA